MKRYLLLGALIVLAVFAALGGVKFLQIRALIVAGAHTSPPPETVASAVARTESWPRTLTAIASVTPVQGVQVPAELGGTVTEIAFESGATVAAGDLLVRLDTSLEEAQLRALEAQADLARINAERLRRLRAENTVAQSELDAAEAALKQALANADAVRATIEKKTIRAPFAGQTGIRLVNLGQYVEAGKPVVSLQALDRVFADFSLPQQELPRLTTGLPLRLTTDAYPGREFTGTLTAINPDLSASTRSVRLQGTFDNPGRLLRPGMFGRVEVLLPDAQTVLAIPATAVFSAPYGDSVFVIEPSTNQAGGLVVRQQFIRIGRMKGDFVSVEAGLKAGDKVVSAGLFKLRNGMSVVENNEVVPKAEKFPAPPNT
ncbi:MAG: efflux RND transporter periplasmic adaptor subunit [Limisphaerales bacterium]|jgi:membrane fusion protein (multidrug efflux system)